MQLPEIAPPDKQQLKQLELSFKFIRCFAEVLKHQRIAYRAVNELTPDFVKIEVANVTFDNCEVQAGRAAAMVMTHSAGRNVFEFSRICVAVPERNGSQFTCVFYGLWKTEDLSRFPNAVQNEKG